MHPLHPLSPCLECFWARHQPNMWTIATTPISCAYCLINNELNAIVKRLVNPVWVCIIHSHTYAASQTTGGAYFINTSLKCARCKSLFTIFFGFAREPNQNQINELSSHEIMALYSEAWKLNEQWVTAVDCLAVNNIRLELENEEFHDKKSDWS